MTRRLPSTAFKKGTSGNPRGRPPGVGSAAKLRAALAEREGEVIEAIINAALAGDTQAAKLVLDRVCPPLRPVESPITFALPAGTLAERAHAVLDAAAVGKVAPGTASTLVQALAATARVVEMVELEQRIAQLEARVADA